MLERHTIQTMVEAQGLRFLGVVEVTPEPHADSFARWLAEGHHGGMAYLEQHQHLRQDPRLLLAGVRSAVIVALPYDQGDRYRPHDKDTYFRIAQYARSKDYHKVMKQRAQLVLDQLGCVYQEQYQQPLVGQVAVDSVPILERSMAVRTERGFRGRNTCYIHPEWGSFLLLGEILLSAPLTPDQSKETANCGSCRSCEVYCPTGALKDHTLDARKCLSYYTIEHRGLIPVAYWPWLKHYVYGCDICQLVCPFNRRSKDKLAGAHFAPPVLPASLPLAEVACMSQAYYEKTFGGTPMTRAKKNGLQRNALIALVVSRDEALAAVISHLQQEGDPLLLQTIEQISDYEGLIRT